MEYTYEEKCKMYENGEYMFQAPPVCHASWTIDSWIKWIDTSGKWTPKTKIS